MPKLKFRPMPEEDMVHELFEAATAETAHLSQVRMLIDYLVLVGLVERDGAVLRAKNGTPEDTSSTAAPAVAVQPVAMTPAKPSMEEGHDSYTLVLDGKTKRKVVIQAPHTITAKELERIRAWLGFQLIVEEETPTT